MTKTNGHSFVKEDFDAEGKGKHDFLIQEIDLFAFAKNSKDDFVTIKKTDKGLRLNDDNSSTPCITTVDLFPEIETPKDNAIELTPAVITSIKTAAKMLASEVDATWRSYVFVGLKNIIGCDGMIAYCKTCEIEDKIILRKEEIAAIPDIGATYSQSQSYDFFESGRFLYGFVKTDQKFFDMTSAMKLPNDTQYLIPRLDLISFNEWVLDLASKPEFASCCWAESANELKCKGEVSYDEKEVERTIKSASGPEFKYLPMNMNKLLKALDADTLYCYRGEKNICLTDEKQSFISLVQQIV
jgi:hypothetical protein